MYFKNWEEGKEQEECEVVCGVVVVVCVFFKEGNKPLGNWTGSLEKQTMCL